MKNVLIALVVVLGMTTTGNAATTSIAFTRSMLAPAGGSFRFGDQTVYLEDGSDQQVTVSFVLPPDFKKNSPALIDFYFEGTGSDGCAYQLNAAYMFRNRLGVAEAGTSNGAKSGFVAASAGATAQPSGDYVVFRKRFKLNKPSGLSVAGQQAGDTITAVVARSGADGADTCASPLYASGGKLIYQTP